MEFDPNYCMAGAVTGLIVGLTGVGGGALMTPILLLIFNVSITTAVATDLWFAAITKIAAIGIHYTHKQIEWDIVNRLWLGSLPVSVLVIIGISSGTFSKVTTYIPQMIGCIVFITAMGLLFSEKLTRRMPNFQLLDDKTLMQFRPILTITAGAILGALVSITSVGAGTLGTLVLIYIYSYLTPQKIIATEIAHAIPLALVAGIGYLIFASVDIQMLFSLLVGSIPMAMVGALLAQRISSYKLKIALAFVLISGGLKLMI
jgi:uncharacterized membrane protein YfcA